MKEICKPLEQFNIQLYYERIFFDKTFYILSSEEKAYLRFCIQPDKNFINQLMLAPVSGFKNFLWPDCPKGIAPLEFLFKNDIWHGLSFIRKSNNFIEVWNFTSTRSNENVIKFYIDNIDWLERFIYYFNQRILDIEEPNVKDRALIKLNSDLFQMGNNQNENMHSKIGLKLNNYILNIDNKNIKLSKREVECLYHLTLGKNIKEIARELSIGNRTVEDYLNNVKLKSGKHSRSQLIAVYLDNNVKIL
jgi:DNA-binding CsgD family transcriptional regulator